LTLENVTIQGNVIISDRSLGFDGYFFFVRASNVTSNMLIISNNSALNGEGSYIFTSEG
jgi:hypothetical protein